MKIDLKSRPTEERTMQTGLEHDPDNGYSDPHCPHCFESDSELGDRLREQPPLDDVSAVCRFCDKRFRLEVTVGFHTELPVKGERLRTIKQPKPMPMMTIEEIERAFPQAEEAMKAAHARGWRI